MKEQTLGKIEAEQQRQIDKWGGGGLSRISPERVLAVLTEEVGEVAQAILMLTRPLPIHPEAARRRRSELEAEIVQVAAVAARWLDECFSD